MTNTPIATAATIPTNWRDKLAVINEFQLSNATAISMFHTTATELETARGLVERGLLIIPALTVDERAKWAPIVSTTDSARASTQTTITVAPKTPQQRKQPTPGAKRGRVGNKIITALNAIPVTPQPIDQFIQAHGISKTVLRQSKRFLDTPIKVSIKRDKATGVEMISRK